MSIPRPKELDSLEHYQKYVLDLESHINVQDTNLSLNTESMALKDAEIEKANTDIINIQKWNRELLNKIPAPSNVTDNSHSENINSETVKTQDEINLDFDNFVNEL